MALRDNMACACTLLHLWCECLKLHMLFGEWPVKKSRSNAKHAIYEAMRTSQGAAPSHSRKSRLVW
eukprot:5651560-Amphidinium_carterae.1